MRASKRVPTRKGTSPSEEGHESRRVVKHHGDASATVSIVRGMVVSQALSRSLATAARAVRGFGHEVALDKIRVKLAS